MTPLIYFTVQGYRAREAERIAALGAWDQENPSPADADEYGWTPARLALSRSFFPAGTAYLAPWYHDPTRAEDMAKRELMLARPESDFAPTAERKPFLSIHYWRDWSAIRPPLMLLCPNYGHWCPDQGSTNGMGWQVTGWQPDDVSQLTASPSIIAGDYHGWLGINGAPPGHFSDPL